MSFNITEIRKDFPILSREVNGQPLIYLDNGASSQKPKIVIDTISNAYAKEYSNVHRGLHYLSNVVTEKYEEVRQIIAKFLNVQNANQIILNSGTTEGINLVAYGWAMNVMQPGDEIVLSIMEHHANIVPWNFLRERYGITLKWVDISEDGYLDPEAVLKAISPKTKLIAVTHLSNVLGTIVDVAQITKLARELDIPVLIDGSQAAMHLPVDLEAIGCDFYAITGHKLCGPSGSGAIFIKQERMKEMRPFIGGGDMIREVSKEKVIYNDPPHLFEAGTPGIVQQIGLGAALEYIMSIGVDNILDYEKALSNYAIKSFEKLSWLEIQGKTKEKSAIFSFTINGTGHPHDVSTILDKKGIAVRAGQHCAGPLMERLGIHSSCRASFAFYNTYSEVDALIEGLDFVHDLLT